MTNVSRAARQLLRDLQWAGLTHLPRVTVPESARGQENSAEAVSDTETASPGERPVAAGPARSAPSRGTARGTGSRPAEKPVSSPAVRTASVSNTVQNDDPLPVRQEKLAAVAACVAECVRCPHLAQTRTQTVFGVGNPQARILFIGEAPGADEDRTGEPFVGKAGQLLTKIIEACGWKREELYLCNILRCRPPENRTPTEVEAQNCREYLDAQIAIVDPEYIVCWGSCAAQNLLSTKEPIGKMRQRLFQHGRARVLCTYHPSYLLRNPAAKKPVWDDMKFLLAEMGLQPPAH